MSFRHLDYTPDLPIDGLGAAAIDDLLDRGDLMAWAPIARRVRQDPWGELADTVLRLCEAHPMYGTSSLWTTWIMRLRGRVQTEGSATLAELRTRVGMTQEQVADRMGIAQSDVSKLERRPNLKLSTLRAYVAALGGALDVTVRLPRNEGAIKLLLQDRDGE